MAEKPVSADELPVDESQEIRGGGLIPRLKVLAFVLAVVALECGAAYVFIPSPSDIEALAAARQTYEPLEEAEDVVEDASTEAEVDLGDFSVTAYQRSSNTTLRIDFKLYGTVEEENRADFEQRRQANEHRFREQVIVTVRGSEVEDLTDAGLGLIKRRILERTNRAIGKPLLKNVIFSEFSFVEQ